MSPHLAHGGDDPMAEEDGGNMRKRLLPLLLALVLLPAAPAAAQVAWDAPWLVPPVPSSEFGIYLMDVHGGSLGVTGLWRSPTGRVGLRGGIAEARDDDIGVLFGVDVAGNITRASSVFPLDVAWNFGAGLGVADWVRLTVPLGITLGHTFSAEGTSFTPYLTPRVFLDAAFDRSEADDSEADLGLAVDIGLDVRLARRFLVRFGAALADRDAVAIGLVF